MKVLDKATSVGVAAHITAASFGGPRYSTSLSRIQRKHINNGIWLCNTCSTYIDKDPGKYTVELLYKWKNKAESESRNKFSGEMKELLNIESKIVSIFNPIMEVDLSGRG